MLPVVSLDPIPCSQVNILKNQRPPKKTNRESKFRGVGLRGENAERQSPQLCERTRRPGKPVNPRKAGWEMVGNNPPKNTTSVLERGESAAAVQFGSTSKQPRNAQTKIKRKNTEKRKNKKKKPKTANGDLLGAIERKNQWFGGSAKKNVDSMSETSAQ